MGGIGRDLKRKAEALGMKVQYHNRKELDGDLASGAKYVGFEELLRTSDVISLNLPLNVSLLSPSSPLGTPILLSLPASPSSRIEFAFWQPALAPHEPYPCLLFLQYAPQFSLILSISLTHFYTQNLSRT